MSAAAQITLAVVALGITFWVVRLVGLRRLRSKYALLWLVITVPLVPLAVFPAIVDEAGKFFGVNYAPALLFSLSSLLLLGIVIHYSWELSRLESRTRRLGEEIALLNARLDDFESMRVRASANARRSSARSIVPSPSRSYRTKILRSRASSSL